MKHSCTMRAIALLSGILCLFGCSLSDHRPPSKLIKNEAKIKSIIKTLTLEEKIAMIHGKHLFTSAGVERLGIADITYTDGPFGIREEMEPHSWHSLGLFNDSSTFFPTGSALAATWSKDLAYAYGRSLAQEARLRGKDMILGPAINIQRLPTGGRTYEYLSEDPFLNAQLSVGYTQGVQEKGVAVCLKHYALNNQENNREQVNVIVSPRTMREIYLLPFEAAVKEADAYGVMAAYNKVAGDWCSENELLLNQILRNEWKFKGMVISDWGGVHHTENAALHGLDVEMPDGRFFGQALLDSVQAGVVPVSVIDEKVRNILRVRFAIEPIPAEEANKTMTAQAEQSHVAYDVAAKSIVLLKNNESFLPLNLNRYKKIAVIGDNAVRKQANGGYGAGVKALYEVTPLEGLQAKTSDRAEIIFSQGYRGFTEQERISCLSPYSEADTKLLQEAVKTAKNADLVLFIAGNNREVETEGSDRTQMILPSGQDEVIKALAAVNPNIVTVVVAGAPVDLSVVDAYSSAIVIAWFNGAEGGNALADVLLGNISPSGKLPFTFPVKLEDSPAYALDNYPQTVAETGSDENVARYGEELLTGYRWFDTKGIAPRYSFGHGLAYTTFEYKDLQTKKEQYGSNESIDVIFELKNTGEREADEVAQLYVHRLEAAVEWPFKELKAFERVTLKGGESQTVTLTVPVSKLRYWNEDTHKWMLEHGEIELLLGSSSSDIRLTKKVKI